MMTEFGRRTGLVGWLGGFAGLAVGSVEAVIKAVKIAIECAIVAMIQTTVQHVFQAGAALQFAAVLGRQLLVLQKARFQFVHYSRTIF